VSADDYIWIYRWQDFQHYRPERDRAPAWIKDYTKQLDDERYLELSAFQRGVLHDLRIAFARTFGRLSTDTRQLSDRLGLRLTRVTLDALSDAGFIEFCSRATLERRLEEVYSSPRARVEGEEELEDPLPLEEGDQQLRCKQCGDPVEPGKRCRTCGATPRQAGSSLREVARKRRRPSDLTKAEAMVRNGGFQYEPTTLQEELAQYRLEERERTELGRLARRLNGDGEAADDEDDW